MLTDLLGLFHGQSAFKTNLQRHSAARDRQRPLLQLTLQLGKLHRFGRCEQLAGIITIASEGPTPRVQGAMVELTNSGTRKVQIFC